MLFVHGNILGFRNVADQLKRWTAERVDVDAVHVDLVAPTWMKVMGKSIPGLHGWDRHQDRYLRMWGRVIDGWFRGPLDLERFDVVHLMTQVNAWAMVRWRERRGAARGDRPRFVVNIDSTAALEVSSFGDAPASRAAFRRAEQRMFDQADLIGCRNAWAATSPSADYGVPPERVHAAVNSIDMPKAARDWSTPRAADDLVKLAFVGTAWKRKGGDLLLRALERARTRCELHVVGADASVAGSTVPPGVVFHGRVPRATLRGELLPTMDGFVLASRFDMLPWAILEGAAAGLGVVAPRTGAIPDVVRPGETGELFEPGDVAGLAAAIDRLAADGETLAARGRAAAAHVRANFDASHTYPTYIDRLVALAAADAENAP